MNNIKYLESEKLHLQTELKKIMNLFNDLIIQARVYRKRLKRIDYFLQVSKNAEN